VKKRIALLGIPLDENSSYLRGSALAPPVIREAFYSDSSNSFSESGLDLSKDDLIEDCGDLNPLNFESIESSIAGLLEKGFQPISLGGDHSITYPILRGFTRMHPDIAILHFDAHPDLYDDFQGNPHSHASPFARIMENGLAQRLIQVGLRTISAHQRDQIRRFGVEAIEMKNFDANLILKFQQPVYLSFDMDALDPAFAPGVSHRETGGLSTREALRVIHALRGRIIGADIVEFNPKVDPSGITAHCCAKLLKEIASKILEAE
jgi:arginase